MLVLKMIKKQWRLYPIGSPKGALNRKREPDFVGNIKFSRNVVWSCWRVYIIIVNNVVLRSFG